MASRAQQRAFASPSSLVTTASSVTYRFCRAFSDRANFSLICTTASCTRNCYRLPAWGFWKQDKQEVWLQNTGLDATRYGLLPPGFRARTARKGWKNQQRRQAKRLRPRPRFSSNAITPNSEKPFAYRRDSKAALVVTQSTFFLQAQNCKRQSLFFFLSTPQLPGKCQCSENVRRVAGSQAQVAQLSPGGATEPEPSQNP